MHASLPGFVPPPLFLFSSAHVLFVCLDVCVSMLKDLALVCVCVCVCVCMCVCVHVCVCFQLHSVVVAVGLCVNMAHFLCRFDVAWFVSLHAFLCL